MYDHTWRAAAIVEVSPCVFLDGDPYERLTNMAQQARANEAQFLEHLILGAEVIGSFQPPVLPSPRPWWNLWSKLDFVQKLDTWPNRRTSCCGWPTEIFSCRG